MLPYLVVKFAGYFICSANCFAPQFYVKVQKDRCTTLTPLLRPSRFPTALNSAHCCTVTSTSSDRFGQVWVNGLRLRASKVPVGLGRP